MKLDGRESVKSPEFFFKRRRVYGRRFAFIIFRTPGGSSAERQFDSPKRIAAPGFSRRS